ncbi:unnamed protein product [Clonostachys rhizophaga]|uniref:Uncharacterized protein n=1 Tax=Clonostachys rhizophaga TaxID=160324 RepID=A0A9N9YRM5_9HYPO|nr:unnamed protein product [Clonostachys rhizophaga]
MESSSIHTDQNRIVEALNAAAVEVDKFVSSAKSPTLLHKEESEKQFQSVLDNIKAFQQLPGGGNHAELEKVIDIGVQWKDYNKQRGKDALAREDDQYLNGLIHRSLQSIERVSAFLKSLIRPVTEPETCQQHLATPQGSAENEQRPATETESRSEVHHDSERLDNESGPCAPTPGPSQSPVSNKRRFVTAIDEPPTPITGPTIDFQEVYQGGNSLIRYTIVDFAHTLSANPTVSGQWWILRCVKCGWHGVNQKTRTLYDGSLHAARCFPQSKITDNASVIDALGVLVLNCDRGLFSRNNDDVKQALIDRSYEPAYRNRNKRTKFVNVPVPQRKSNEPPIVTDPKVGMLYLAHQRGGLVFGAIVLPLGDFRSRVGIRGSIYDPEAFRALPDCYRFHEGQRKFFWAEGYEDGGGNVTMRQFPVYYLDGPSVEMGHVRWASADDLEPFDVTKVAAGYEKPVEEYTRFCQCNNGIKPFSCVNPDHGESSEAANGDQESNRPTQPTSESPIVIEDDEALSNGPDTSTPEDEQIPFVSISSTQAPVHPTNLESHNQVDGEANSSDISAPNTSNSERFPSSQFYIPPEMDMDEAVYQQEQTVSQKGKAPEAFMDLGGYASATASPVVNRPAAATMQVIKVENGQGENVNSMSYSIPSPTSSGPTVQGHDVDSRHSHYQFSAESPQFSIPESAFSTIHGL